MNERNKGITAIFCTCLAGVPLFFSVWFLVGQQLAYRQMKEKLEKSQLQVIVVSRNDVHWVKPGKEIRIHGKMFDIKARAEKGDSLYFTGLYDEDEDDLYERFRAGTEGFAKRQSAKLYVQTLSLVFLQWEPAGYLPVALASVSRQYGIYSAFLPFISLLKHVPPPKC